MEQFQISSFAGILLPVLIFCSRVIDVSIGTMRVIFVSRGYRWFAVVCGFFEVLIWLIAITQIMQNLTNVYNYLAYASGFAAGNYVGMFIEEKIAIGKVMIRIITPNDVSKLRSFLKKNSYGATLLQGNGHYRMVNILFSAIPRQEIKSVVACIKENNPHAFYTIEDIRYVTDDHPGVHTMNSRRRFPSFLRRPLRKGK